MKYSKILLVAIILTSTVWVNAQDGKSEDFVIGKTYSIKSKILKEDRKYSVYLPASYNDIRFAPKAYSVLYLMDGEMHFQATAGMIHHMSSGTNWNHQIPEMIIVAIHNYKGIRERRRDLTPTAGSIFPDSGGGIKFLTFIESEIMPIVEGQFRTNGYRVFAGHSLGGLMSLYSFLDPKSPYQAYIAMDPSIWWDSNLVLERAKKELPNFSVTNRILYIGSANNGPGSSASVDVAKEFHELVKSLPKKNNIHSGFGFFEDENHQAVPLINTYEGLKFIFQGYNEGYTVFAPGRKFEDIQKHYRDFAQRVGHNFLPPEDVVFSGARSFIQSDTETAIKLFEMNTNNYPTSFRSFMGIASSYKFKGDTANAIRYFQKVLDLNPQNTNARNQIELLKK